MYPGGGGAGPSKFCQVPFFREQSALFLREKCHKDSPFCPKGTFENLICYFPENFFHFREKNGILGKLFSYLGKNAICPENFFRYVRKKIFEMPFFILKVPLKAWPPPQLLEASYAPVCTSSEHS